MEKKNNIIFGLRSVYETIDAGKEIDKVLLKKGQQNPQINELITKLKAFGVPFQFVPQEKLDRITRKNHQGCIAFISPVEFQNYEEIIQKLFESGKTPLILILDQITDIRNFGAICRTAECAGTDAVIIPYHGAAAINEDAVKTSSGALMRIPICKSFDLRKSVLKLKQYGLRIVAASEKAKTNYFENDFTIPTAIVLGSEGKGIDKEILDVCDEKLRIPLQGEIDSLNVSVASGVILFEAVKQRIN